MIPPPSPRPSRRSAIRLAAALTFLPSALYSAPAPDPGGILVYRAQPWHKPDQAQVSEFLRSRQFSAVVYVTDFEGNERQLQRSLIFAVHDYLPFDARGTVKIPLSAQIAAELKTLTALASAYPGTRDFVGPRIEKWKALPDAAPPPAASEEASPTPEATGKFATVDLPTGGALGNITRDSGETFQVWITALTPTEIKWDEPVKEGSGVYRQRSLPLSDVRSLAVYTAEDVARIQFRQLAVPPTSLTPMAYRVLYQYYFRLLENMRAEFGADPRYAEWHSVLVRIREDMEQAQSTNSVKLNGRWLGERAMQGDSDEIAAAVLWASARQMITLGEWNLGIQYLYELTRDHTSSRAFVENLPQIEQWTDAFGKDRSTLSAIARNPRLERSAASIRTTLESFDRESAMKSLKLSAEAQDALAAGDAPRAAKLLEESRSAWSANGELPKLRKQPDTLAK